jgi:DNA invertase Pin-like site-specific DNA recombinase
MTRYGLARISEGDPNPGGQEAELGEYGCVPVFTDYGSAGAGDDRPGQVACLAALEGGDTLVVTSLDVLAQTARPLAQLLGDLARRYVTVHILDLDLTVSPGAGPSLLVGAILAADRQVSLERARGGALVNVPGGRGGGRKPTLSDRQKKNIRAARERGETVPSIAERYKRSVATINRVLGNQAPR